MAVYRIKKEADQEKQIFTGEEYWQISPLEEDLPYLDMKEIAELNLLAEDMPIPKAKMGFWGQAIMSIVFLLITFALLIGMSGIYFRQPLPDLGFLSQSSQLQEDPLLQKAAQSVVRVEMAQSHGSGFNIAADGLIITNHHVLEGVGNINIRFADGSLFTDCPWQAVEGFDLAVIDIKGHDLPFLPMAELFPKVDDPIFFIGNPLDFNFVFSQGKVLDYWANEEGKLPFLLISGPVYPGSSGSPLLNKQGQVIGIIFASLNNQDEQGLAIPIQALMKMQ